MRIFFSFIIAAVLTFFADGVSFAQVKGEPCHEQDHVIAEDTNKSVCCRFDAMHMLDTGAWDETIAAAGCCPPQACGTSIIIKDIFHTVLTPPVVSAGNILKPFPIQPLHFWTLGVSSSGRPPPRWPSFPVYIYNCSFLI